MIGLHREDEFDNMQSGPRLGVSEKMFGHPDETSYYATTMAAAAAPADVADRILTNTRRRR
jgi:hypothetical protein